MSAPTPTDFRNPPQKPAQARPADAPKAGPPKAAEPAARPADAAPARETPKADAARTPAPPVDHMAEYRSAYRALKDRDPDLARKYPDPDEPGRNIDAATVLKQLRSEPGGVTTDRPADLKA